MYKLLDINITEDEIKMKAGINLTSKAIEIDIKELEGLQNNFIKAHSLFVKLLILACKYNNHNYIQTLVSKFKSSSTNVKPTFFLIVLFYLLGSCLLSLCFLLRPSSLLYASLCLWPLLE